MCVFIYRERKREGLARLLCSSNSIQFDLRINKYKKEKKGKRENGMMLVPSWMFGCFLLV